MIYVTAGHEKGIGLEVFLKSFLCLDKKSQNKFTLICKRSALETTLNSIKIDLSFLESKLEIRFTEERKLQTLSTIKHVFEIIKSEDILLTLPSSKDEFEGFNGHTEYFRNKYSDSNIVMSFLSPKLNTLLLTDHIPVSEISKTISVELVVNKTKNYLSNIQKIRKINQVIFSGINPHNGEDGRMGDEDKFISTAITKLKSLYPNISFKGPLPGDTISFEEFTNEKLFVFSAHDQGLAVFKQFNGLLGINLTLGLPFLRVSPDHGTAFDMFGKNKANYLGMNYLLNEILKWKS